MRKNRSGAKSLRPAGRSAEPRSPLRKPARSAERLKPQFAFPPDDQRSLAEEQEASAEQLCAVNEEILSSNELLQRTNEELQSSNEELSALNEKLQRRNVQLAQTASDLSSLLNSIEVPIVILGSDRSIRHFTPAGGQLLNIVPSDVGRPISKIRSNLDDANLDDMAAEVLLRKTSLERQVRDRKGHWYALRMRPHRTVTGHVRGVFVLLVDIHDVTYYTTAIVKTMRGCLLVLDTEFHVLVASPGFIRTFKIAKEATEGRLLWDLGDGQWDIPQLRELLEKVLPEKKCVKDFELNHEFSSIGNRKLLVNTCLFPLTDVESPRILLVIEDVTARKAVEEKIRQLLARVMTAAEDEDKRIAREVHDSLGPRLASINLQVSQLAGRLSSQPDLVEELEEIRNAISDVAKAAHDISHELHPAVLSELGLAAALEAECDTFSKLHGTVVNFSAENVPDSLSEAVALCLYRVAQASLENIRQHAQSKRASITLAGSENEIVMGIQDFGRGFDLNDARRQGGLGLLSMEERVRFVRGRLTLTSDPGRGTKIEVRIPVSIPN